MHNKIDKYVYQNYIYNYAEDIVSDYIDSIDYHSTIYVYGVAILFKMLRGKINKGD